MEHARWTFEAIGTCWDVSCLIPEEAAGEARTALLARIEAFDASYSRFRSDSLIRRIAQQPGEYEMPEDWEKLWSVYERLYKLSHGAFTPLIGSLLEDLGYDASYSLSVKDLRPVLRLDEVISCKGRRLTAEKPALLDIGAGGKGYLVDIAAALLAERGARDITIDAGGDILHRGENPLRVGLEDPDDASLAVGVVEIHGESICASAGNRRRWRGLHHIVDPRTKQPVDSIAASWVIARDALEADALSTALFFSSPEKLAQEFSFEWARLMPDRSASFSPRFQDAFSAGAGKGAK